MATLTRDAIVAEARSWLGTPYRHQASVRGVGCDCLGLVRGVWRALIGPEPIEAPPYTPDWAEAGDSETLECALARVMRVTALRGAAPGDVVAFRMRAGSPAKHVAILSARDRIIHAYWARAVVESRFAPWWQSRVAGVFSFPGAMPWQS